MKKFLLALLFPIPAFATLYSNAYNPLSSTYGVGAQSSAGTPFQITISGTYQPVFWQCRVQVPAGGGDVWMTIATSSSGATQTLPSYGTKTAGTAGNATYLLAGTVEVFGAPPNPYFNFQSTTGTVNLTVNCGEGF